MIDKFATVYAGHVDLPDMGQGATPANERRYPNEHLATVFEKTEAVARAMDDLGYHAIWLAEHHFQHEGYECLPNILMTAVHLAHVTPRIRIGCAFNIAPMWHPLRLAEDFATADILTRGRVIFGVGRGYHTREVETFGAPMLEAAARAGRNLALGEDLCLGIFFYLAETREKAIREITPFYEEHVKMFAPLGFVPGITPAQVEAAARRGGWGAAGVPTVEHYMKTGAWFAGPPEELVAYLKDLEARFPGLEHVNMSISMGTPKAVMPEQLRWFAEEVMPKFSAARPGGQRRT